MGVIEALNHRDSNIEHDVGEEHGGADEKDPQQELIAICEEVGVRLANRDEEDKENFVGEVLTACEGIEGAGEGEYEASENDEEEAHEVHHSEDHTHQVANLAEVAQEIEEFEEEEERGTGVDRLLDLK